MTTPNKKHWIAAAAAAILFGAAAPGAMAFQDLEGVPHADKIIELKNRGIVNGLDGDNFMPQAELTAQQAVPLIVRSMELSLAKYIFIKQPLAGDSFSHVSNNAWYADAFVVAAVNGVPIDPEIDPAESVTREQFVQWLIGAVDATGDYPWIKVYRSLEDEKHVSEGRMDAIQKALAAGIAEAEEDTFRPQQPITRGEAAVMARNAIAYVERQRALQIVANPIRSGEVKPSIRKATDEVNRVILDMGERPHAGWSVQIEGVDLIDGDSAVIRYSVAYPDPAAQYADVISHPKAETYLGAAYTDVQYELVGVERRPPDPEIPNSAAPESDKPAGGGTD